MAVANHLRAVGVHYSEIGGRKVELTGIGDPRTEPRCNKRHDREAKPYRITTRCGFGIGFAAAFGPFNQGTQSASIGRPGICHFRVNLLARPLLF
jgi:hypothetical protein